MRAADESMRNRGRTGVCPGGGLSRPGTARIGLFLITSIKSRAQVLGSLPQASPQIIPPFSSSISMHHRPSYRQSHTPAPAYNTGYGGYTTPAPPPHQGGHHGGAHLGGGNYGAGHAGYSPQPPQRGPPAGADAELWHWFSAVDTDRSGSITVTELQSALVNGAFLRPLVSLGDLSYEADFSSRFRKLD